METVLPMRTQQLAVFVSNTPWVASEQKGTLSDSVWNEMSRETKCGKIQVQQFSPFNFET